MSTVGGSGYGVGDYPESWRPIVGYLYWRLVTHGDPQLALSEYSRQHKWPHLAPGETARALRFAQQLLVAAETARSPGSLQADAAVGMGLFPLVGPYHVIGVRVVVDLVRTDGATRQISVLVNAAANAPIQSVLAAAEAFAAAMIQQDDQGQYLEESVVSSEVSQISGVQWSNAPVVVGPGG